MARMADTMFGGAPGSKINLVRRVPTSGTQSASDIRFLATPCASGVPQGQLFPARAGAYAGGSGDRDRAIEHRRSQDRAE